MTHGASMTRVCFLVSTFMFWCNAACAQAIAPAGEVQGSAITTRAQRDQYDRPLLFTQELVARQSASQRTLR